jgi:hypothetical protein
MKKFFVLIMIYVTLSPNVFASEKNIETLEKKFIDCCETYKQQEQKCPESWNMKCYNHLMSTYKNTQKCFRNIAVELFENFYGLSKHEAEKKFEDYNKFIYDQYFFIFAETDFCRKNNCGISIDLHSEYTTTDQLRYFVNKIIRSISARN